jgi:hypothetical protein
MVVDLREDRRRSAKIRKGIEIAAVAVDFLVLDAELVERMRLRKRKRRRGHIGVDRIAECHEEVELGVVGIFHRRVRREIAAPVP